jgi:hypothetical protein
MSAPLGRIQTPSLAQFLTAPTHLSHSLNTPTCCFSTNTDTETDANTDPPKLNLDEVASLLALDLANVFLRKINVNLYDFNVVLEDRIRGMICERKKVRFNKVGFHLFRSDI